MVDRLIDTEDRIIVERQGAGALESSLGPLAGHLRVSPGSGREIPTCPSMSATKWKQYLFG